MLEVLEAASFELNEASAWYEGRVSGLGERLLAEVENIFSLIVRHPAMGSPWLLPGIPLGVRHIPLRTFPYAIVYVREPRLVVIAVAHTSQDPTYWIDRLVEISSRP